MCDDSHNDDSHNNVRRSSTPPASTEAVRPTNGDLQLLRLLALGRGAAAASETTGQSLILIANRLTALREQYGVLSTRAALTQAQRLGHLTVTQARPD